MCESPHFKRRLWTGMCLVKMKQVRKRQLWLLISSQEPGKMAGGVASTFLHVSVSDGKKCRMKKVDFFFLMSLHKLNRIPEQF